LEIPVLFKVVAGSSGEFPVISQNRRLKRKNRRCKAQHQAFAAPEQGARIVHRAWQGSEIRPERFMRRSGTEKETFA
jgi:hypothetical protein